MCRVEEKLQNVSPSTGMNYLSLINKREIKFGGKNERLRSGGKKELQ